MGRRKLNNKNTNVLSISILFSGLFLVGIFYILDLSRQKIKTANTNTTTIIQNSKSETIKNEEHNPYESLYIKHLREVNNPYASLFGKYAQSNSYNESYSSLYNFLKSSEGPNSSYSSLYLTEDGEYLY